MDLGLKGKNAIVTGAGNGIGFACAKVLAEEGCNIALADLNVEAAEERAKELAEKYDGNFVVVKVDITDRDSLHNMVEEAAKLLGNIEVAVNSAGISAVCPMMELTDDKWDLMFKINSKGMFMAIQEETRYMVDNGIKGTVVNISSQAGKKHVNLEGHYSASKSTVNMMTQSFAIELGDKGIRINAVCPGSVKSPMNHRVSEARGKILGMTEEQFVANTIKNTPLGRQCDPEEIAYVVAFLAGDKSSFMTGQSVNVTGGRVFW